MSIHVVKCVHRGNVEYHLRYPGMTEEQAQAIADQINGGVLDSKWGATACTAPELEDQSDNEWSRSLHAKMNCK